MFVSMMAIAAFLVNDRYEPSGAVAWLCPTPEAAAEIGLKTEGHAAPGLISALASARKCESWEAGALNIRGAKRVGSQEVGLIRIAYGSAPETSYWVARNTLRWVSPGAGPTPRR